MILGIGTDMVYVPRMKKLWAKQGRAFLDRCYTTREIDYIMQAENEDALIARLAKRWAAKEAAAKALGTGISGMVYLSDIETVNQDNGCPHIYFYGGALDALNEKAHGLGTPEGFISLSDDGDFAQAFVVLSLKNL